MMLPSDFAIPDPPPHADFVVTPLRIDHIVLDYDAVMSSQAELWSLFGPGWGWPKPDMSLTQDLIDLGWHQKEFQRRSSFAWAVLTPDQRRMLGCCYVEPTRSPRFDAEATYWVRTDAKASGMEPQLDAYFRHWLAASWPFKAIAWPGRDHKW
jgi:hypothetical protein